MPSHTVRVLCEARSQSRSVRDAATGEVPFFWRGSSVVIQLGLTDNGAHLLRAGVGTLIVEVKALNASSADDSLMRKEFVAADCDATFTAADWAGGTKQLLAAAFTLGEAALPPATYRLIIRHVAADSSEMTYLSAELRILDPQSGSEGIAAPPVAWSYLEALPVLRCDADQTLTTAQKAQAFENLGVTLTGPTAITLPTSGMLISEAYGDSRYGRCWANGHISTVALNSTTLADVAGMTVSDILPVGKYLVEISFSAYSDPTGNLKWALASSGVITTQSENRATWFIGTEAGSGVKTVANWPSGTAWTAGGGTNHAHRIVGVLNLTAAGNLRFQAAKNASGGSNSQIYDGSIVIRKIA